MLSREDLLAQARKYKALYPRAGDKNLRTDFQRHIENYDEIRQLPGSAAGSGNELGCLLAVLLWPFVAVRNLFVMRKYGKMIEEVIAIVQREG